jgi:hypothetical protein
MCILHRFVGAGLHKSAETTADVGSGFIDIDDILNLGVVKEEAVDWSISAVDEARGEAADIQSLDTGFGLVFASKKFHGGIGMV